MGSQKTFNNTKLPVFLMHGFITSAIDWVSQPYTTDNLPYMLSDAGYDVWLGNNRGNVFSVHNERLDMNSVEFWDQIDFDQMAELDVPAIIDYVTKTTGAPKMHWVGHSMGGGVLVEALALDPSLKDRLSTSALLAPGVHMAHLKVQLLKTMVATHMDQIWHKAGVDIPSIATHNKYFPGPGFAHIMEYFTGKTPLCRVSTKLCNDIGKLMGISVGDPKNLDPETMALAYNLDPGGASFHLIMHYAQRVRTDKIQKFDWGTKRNQEKYNGSATPPYYGLSKINGVKMAMWVGEKDLFWTQPDVDSMMKAVPADNWMPVASYSKIDTYAHFDFVWGKDAHTRLYPAVIDVLSQESGAVETD